MTASSLVARVKERDTRLDALSGWLIGLVVLGHVLGDMGGDVPEAVYLWVYMFHMPAFVWLSGYVTQLSRRVSVGTLAARLLFPYFVFELVNSWLRVIFLDESFSYDPITPGWTLWYLVALFAWRIATPVLERTRWVVAVAVVLSLLVGLDASIGEPYSAARIFGLLPFFTLGLLWKREWTVWLSSGWRPPAGAAALAAALMVAATVAADAPREAWYYSDSYAKMGQSQWEGLGLRALVIAGGALLVCAAISVAYRHSRAMATVGVATLSVYLLHPVAIYVFRADGWPDSFVGPLGLAVGVVFSALLTWAFSRRVVVRVTRPLMDYRWWRKDAPQARESSDSSAA